MRKRICILSCFTIVMLLCSLLSACQNEQNNTIDYAVAGECALSYLEEKYNEKFVIVSEREMHNSLLGGEAWYRAFLVRESEQSDEEANQFEVNVTLKNNEYFVLGDTVMFSYIQDITEMHLDQILNEHIKSFDYELTVIRTTLENTDYGFDPDIEIPEDMEDIDEMMEEWQTTSFIILVPDEREMSSLSNICQVIGTSLQTSSISYSGSYLAVIDEDVFQEITSSENLYDQFMQTGRYREYTLYEILVN